MSSDLSILRDQMTTLNSHCYSKAHLQWIAEHVQNILVEINKGNDPHRESLERLNELLKKKKNDPVISDSIKVVDFYLGSLA